MAMHSHSVDSNDRKAEATSYTVFVDTSLDTHLVSIFSSSDTVSDFKKKILLQHSESFPRIGRVNIHSMQVKRKGHFYHLPDAMLVSSAFDGCERTRFLFVEASCSEKGDREQLLHKLLDGSGNCRNVPVDDPVKLARKDIPQAVPVEDPVKLAGEDIPQAVQASTRNIFGEISRDIEMEVGHLQKDSQKEFSSDMDKNLAFPRVTHEKCTTVSENSVHSEDDDSRENNKTTAISGLDELPSAGEKHKLEHIENVGFTMKKKHKIENKKDSLVDAHGKVSTDIQGRKIMGELRDTFSSDANLMSITGAQKTSQSETNAEQSGKLEREEVDRAQSNFTTGEHKTKGKKVPSSKEIKEDKLVIGEGSKKEKKKKKKILSVPQDQVATLEPNSPLYGSVFHANLNTEAPEANKNEAHVELVLNHDSKVMVRKPLEAGEADGTNEESIPSPNFMGTSSPTEAADSIRTKMKKTRTKKKTPCSTGKGTKTTGAISSTVADLDPKDLANEKIMDHESILPLDESQKNNIVEKERALLHNHDPQVQPSESLKPSDKAEAQDTDKGLILSHNLSLADETEAGNSGTIKRKKRKAKKSAANLQDKSDIDNLHETSSLAQGVVLDVEMNDETTEKNKNVHHFENELKNDKELPSEYKPEVALPEGNTPLDSGKATMVDKESGFAEMSLDDKHGLEAGKSVRSHKKKRVKKPPITNDNISPMEHSNPVDASPSKYFEGDRGLSLEYGPEVISSKASRTLDLGEATANCSDSGCAAQILDAEDGIEAEKSGGGQKKKRAKKYANSVCDAPVKHLASEAQGNQSIFSCTEEKKKLENESRDASISHVSKASESKKIASPLAETDKTLETAKDCTDDLKESKNGQCMDTSALKDQSVKLQANELQHLVHDGTNKEQENAKNIKKKVKKTKRNLNNVVEADIQSNLKTKGQNSSIEELAASGDKTGDGNHPYDTVNTSISAETRTGDRSAISELMLNKNAGFESKFSNAEEARKGVESSEVPSYHTKSNLEGRPEAMMNIESIVETYKAGDEGVNFRHYFLPEQHQNEDASANQVNGALHSTEAKRKRKKINSVSDRTLKSNRQRYNKFNTNDNQNEESSADAKGNHDMPGTNKDISQTVGNVVKASRSHDVDKGKTPRKTAKPVVANGSGSGRNNPSWLEENNRAVTASSSSSSAKGSKRAFEDTTNRKQQSGFKNGSTSARKSLSKNDEDIVNSSQQQKSLLSAPGAIFSDHSSESFGDENGIGNSDASTRTPSDNSSSSGYSNSESESSQDSRGNGSENAKKENGGGKSSLNSKFQDPKDMSLDMILRSSKRFKKAKLTASQSQEADTESQPVDFVPDSQAN